MWVKNTVFSAINDLGSLFHPNPLFMSSKMRSFPPTHVVGLDNIPCRGFKVVRQYAPVCVLPFPQVRGVIHLPLPLYDKPVCLPLPFIHKDGIQFILDATYFLFPPSFIRVARAGHRRANRTGWHGYRSGCNVALTYARFPPSMSRSRHGSG